MGIQGLLPFLKGAMVSGHVDAFRDQVVAVDAYSWLHRGAYSCARELADGTPTDRYLSFSRKRITMLRGHKVEPLLVFDGRSLPSKAVTDSDRRQRRTTNKALAEKALSEGKNAEANILYQRSISITPALAFALIQMCRQMHVNYIVAPYEADSQMAFLATTNRVAAVITEDSDLIAFGCAKIIYKLEPTGVCVMYDKELLKDDKAIGVAMSSFSDAQLLEMCILSGCDYLPSVAGMGIKTAFKYIKQFGSAHQAIRRLRASSKFTIPSTYSDDFARALQTFKYQRVYNPDLKTLVTLNDFEEVEEIDAATQENRDYYIGPHLEDDIAQSLADGKLNPKTLEPYAEPSPISDGQDSGANSQWAEDKPTSNYFSQRHKKSNVATRKPLQPLPKGQRSLFDMARTKKKPSGDTKVTSPVLPAHTGPAVPGMFTLTDLQTMNQHMPHKAPSKDRGGPETTLDGCARTTISQTQGQSARKSPTTTTRASIRDMFSFAGSRHTEHTSERQRSVNPTRRLQCDAEHKHRQVNCQSDEASQTDPVRPGCAGKTRVTQGTHISSDTKVSDNHRRRPISGLGAFRYNKKGAKGGSLFDQQSSFEAMERLPGQLKQPSNGHNQPTQTRETDEHRVDAHPELHAYGNCRGSRGGKVLDYIDEDEGDGEAVGGGYYTTIEDEEAEKLKHIAHRHSKRISLPLRKMGRNSVQSFSFDNRRKNVKGLHKECEEKAHSTVPEDETDKENVDVNGSGGSTPCGIEEKLNNTLYQRAMSTGTQGHESPGKDANEYNAQTLQADTHSTQPKERECTETLGTAASSPKKHTSPARTQKQTKRLRHGLSRPQHTVSDDVHVRVVRTGPSDDHRLRKDTNPPPRERTAPFSDAAEDIDINNLETENNINSETICIADSEDDSSTPDNPSTKPPDASCALPLRINRHTMPLQALEQDRLDREARNNNNTTAPPRDVNNTAATHRGRNTRVQSHDTKHKRPSRGLPRVNGAKRPKTALPKTAGTLLQFAFKPKPRVKGTV